MLKEDVKQMIDKLPENCSIEDIQYTLYVRSKIDKGQKDIEEGSLLTHDKVKARMDKWLNKNNRSVIIKTIVHGARDIFNDN